METNHDLFLGNKNYTTETYQYTFEDDSNSILYEADIENTDPSFRWVLYLLPNELKETFFRMRMKIRIQHGFFLVHMKSLHFDVEMTVTVNPDITDKIDNIHHFDNSVVQDINIHKMDLVSDDSKMYSYSFIKNRVKSQIKSFVRQDFQHFIQHIHQWTMEQSVEKQQ